MNGWALALLSGGLYCALAVQPAAALAQGGDGASPPVGSPEAVASARSHFAHAKELYGAGSYREAIHELDAARALDPKAKDLVYNLAIVHEKLGEIDDALRYAKLYLDMDLDATERARGEGYVKRLEGAKSEVVVVPKPPGATSGATTRDTKPTPNESGAPHGRIDALTIGAGGVAVAGVIAGTVFGIKALADNPSSSFKTGTNGTYQDLENDKSSAHTEAVVADVCFGVAIAAAAGAAALYFGRTRDPDAAQQGKQGRTWHLVPMAGPGATGLLLGGTF